MPDNDVPIGAVSFTDVNGEETLNSRTPESTSTSTTTPVTDNRDVVDALASLPEATHQPLLDTIHSAPKSTTPNQASNRTTNTMGQHDEYASRETSPRSIDLKDTIHAKQAPPRVVTASSPRPQANAMHAWQHRRTHSEEMLPDHPVPFYSGLPQQPPLSPSPVYGNQYPMGFPGNVPPPQMLPSPRHARRQSDHRQLPRPTHQRVRSLPSAPHPGMGIPPVPGLSAAGNPLIPILPEGGSSQYGSASPSAARNRKRTFSDGRRQRNGSFSGPVPGLYGSFDEGPPPPPQSSSPSNWTPHQEFKNLTKGSFQRNARSGMTPPASPIRNGSISNYARMSPRASPKAPNLSGSLRMHGYPPRSEDLKVTFSPGTPLQDGWVAGASAAPNLQQQPHGVWDSQDLSPNLQMDPSPMSNNQMSHQQVPQHGEAVFQARNRGRRSGSMRKMHMRQQSAQLFMEEVKGSQQAPACRNILFVLLFLFHLVGMAFLGNTYGPDAFVDETAGGDLVAISYRNVIYVACLCGAFAVTLSTLALVLMTVISKKLVQVALIFTIALAFAWGTIGIGLSPKNFVPITGVIFFALSVGYTFVVWERIPFAAANLHTGLSGIRANSGTVVVAFAFQFLALLWTIYFTYVLIGVYDAVTIGHLQLSHQMQVFVYTVLGLSYYWTFHVLMNIVQVTVARVVGDWWFKPDGPPELWNESVSGSLFSALFYGFGSICFGSLLVGPVRLLRTFAAFFRPSQDESSLMCLHQCLNCIQRCVTNCVDTLADQFNAWAYTYVGLYGYGLLDAGQMATELFEKRGWSKIVTDDLVPNVLLMVSCVVGGVTGCFGILIQQWGSLGFTSFHEPVITSFLIGLGVGWVLTSVLFGIISSSVNAVIVCFAGSPVEFERNHPGLSSEMRTAWREVWPGCMDVVDMRVAIATQSSSFSDAMNGSADFSSERHPLL